MVASFPCRALRDSRTCLHNVGLTLLHSKNWSVKNNSSSIIFKTSEECEEGQHSECYTNTPWGVAILTHRKCYLDLTIGSVALTLLESCFDTLDNTLYVGLHVETDTLTGCFDNLHLLLWKLGPICGCRVTIAGGLWTIICGFRVHISSVI